MKILVAVWACTSGLQLGMCKGLLQGKGRGLSNCAQGLIALAEGRPPQTQALASVSVMHRTWGAVLKQAIPALWGYWGSL